MGYFGLAAQVAEVADQELRLREAEAACVEAEGRADAAEAATATLQARLAAADAQLAGEQQQAAGLRLRVQELLGERDEFVAAEAALRRSIDGDLLQQQVRA